MHHSGERSLTERRLRRFVAGCIALLLGCGDGTGPDLVPGLHIVSGGSAVDSIGSVLGEPLAVILADDAGKPVAGEVVSFTVASGESAFLAREGSSALQNSLADTTDERGRAAVLVRRGESSMAQALASDASRLTRVR